MRRPGPAALAVSAGFALLACLYTYPVVLAPGRLAGSGDYYQFVWDFWWVKTALAQGRLPFFTDIQYFPTGTSLAYHDMTYHWSLLALPLQWLMSPVAVLNLFLIFSFAATGVATYVMLRGFDCERVASFAGGVFFAFCVHRLNRFYTGEINSLGTMYMPLFLLSFQRVYEPGADDPRRGRLVHAGLAGLFLALTFLCSWYNGLFLGLLAAMWFAYQTLRTRRFPFAGLLLTGGTFLLLVAPFIAPMVRERADFSHPTYAERIAASEYNNADLLSYVVFDRPTPNLLIAALYGAGIDGPLRWVDRVHASYYGNPLEKSTFIGYTVLTLALLGPFLWRKLAPHTRQLLVFAYGASAIFFVLSLGPTLYIAGSPSIQLAPYRWLMHVPFLNVSRTPSRMGVMVILCLSIAAALVLDFLVRRLGRRAGCALVVLVLSAYGLETFPGRPQPMRDLDALVPPYLAALGRVPFETVLLNIPVDFSGARGGGDEYLMQQTAHSQRIVGGYVSREPTYAMRTLRESDFLQAIHHREYEQNGRLTLDRISDSEIRGELGRLDVGLVVLHRRRLGDDFPEIDRRIHGLFGPGVYADEQVKIFRAGVR